MHLLDRDVDVIGGQTGNGEQFFRRMFAEIGDPVVIDPEGGFLFPLFL